MSYLTLPYCKNGHPNIVQVMMVFGVVSMMLEVCKFSISYDSFEFSLYKDVIFFSSKHCIGNTLVCMY